MHWFKADLHIHSVLSPCGGLDMSPINIIRQAVIKKLDIIAITDHNSTTHCRSAMEIGRKLGITVLAGAEINTIEEVHCLTFFENIDKAELFQQFIDEKLTVVENKPEIFGHQYVVDENENIIREENRLLVAALQSGIDEVSEVVAELNGLLIPAHINRRSNGIYNQLGFLPSTPVFNALEIFPRNNYREFMEAHNETGHYRLITNSDAHSLDRIGEITTDYFLENATYGEILMALKNEYGRKVRIS